MWNFWFGYSLGASKRGGSSGSGKGGGVFLGVLIFVGLYLIYKLVHGIDSKLIHAAHHHSWATKVFFPYLTVVYYNLSGQTALNMCLINIVGAAVGLFVIYMIQNKLSHSVLRKLFIPFKLISLYAYGCILYNGFIVGHYYALDKWGPHTFIYWILPIVVGLIIFRGIRMVFIKYERIIEEPKQQIKCPHCTRPLKKSH
jgi:hypothetical protein